jgi:hypothetical protein
LPCAINGSDLPAGRDTVVELAACGRARWKTENETFNVLKNKGYNLERSFGHGKKNLAAILVNLNLLAFAIHTVCDIGGDLWRATRTKLGPRYNFFNKLAAITIYLIFLSSSPWHLRYRHQSHHERRPTRRRHPLTRIMRENPPTNENQNGNWWAAIRLIRGWTRVPVAARMCAIIGGGHGRQAELRPGS